MDPKRPESSADQTSGKDVVKYKGVRLRKWGKWVSEIRLPNSRERIWLGSYDSAEKAARAFDAAQFCLRGRDGRFNFQESVRIGIDLVGGHARALTPSEIQEIASHYGNSFNAEGHPPQEKEEELRETNDPPLGATLEPNHITSITSPVVGAFGMESLDWPSSSNYYDSILGPNPNTDYGLMLSTLDHMHEDMYMTQHFGHANNAPEQEEQSVDESFLWNF